MEQNPVPVNKPKKWLRALAPHQVGAIRRNDPLMDRNDFLNPIITANQMEKRFAVLNP